MFAPHYFECASIFVYSIVYLSDTASECVLEELLRAVYAGTTLSPVSRTGIVAYR